MRAAEDLALAFGRAALTRCYDAVFYRGTSRPPFHDTVWGNFICRLSAPAIGPLRSADRNLEGWLAFSHALFVLAAVSVSRSMTAIAVTIIAVSAIAVSAIISMPSAVAMIRMEVMMVAMSAD